VARPWSTDEPARQQAYRRLYKQVKLKFDQIDDTVDFLLTKISRIEKRIHELEARTTHDPPCRRSGS
jgi:hypothetical protein